MAARRRTPSPNHLEALDKGRRSSKAIRAYLEWLREAAAPKPRGKPIDWQKRLDDAEKALEYEQDVMQQLALTQQLLEAQEMLQVAQVDTVALEAGFIEWAGWYSEQHGISYNTWIRMGVPADMLRKAGIKP
jgi:hypothetical protein